VNRDILTKQPSGWLATWALQLEQQQCVTPGRGFDIATRIADSLPMDPGTSLHLLYANEMQTGELPLNSNTRVRLTSPLWRIPGVGLMAEGPYELTGHGYSLQVMGRSTENLVGVEKITYAIKSRGNVAGFTIAPVYAEQSVDGVTERRSKPTTDLLDFPINTAFYKVFYKSWQNEFTAIVVGARTPVELERHIELLRTADPAAACKNLGRELCAALPNDVGLMVFVAVTVNGSEVFVPRGATVFNAIASAGESKPKSVVHALKVCRPWNDRPVAVAFNPADDTILKLVVRGGEVISWR
jgi:hypothetical protein